MVREHVRVLSVSAAELTVGEATCQGDSGGPALDEDTGEVVGVVSRGGPSCEGAGVHNIYTRVDTFSWLVDEAFAKVAGSITTARPTAGAPASRAAARDEAEAAERHRRTVREGRRLRGRRLHHGRATASTARARAARRSVPDALPLQAGLGRARARARASPSTDDRRWSTQRARTIDVARVGPPR